MFVSAIIERILFTIVTIVKQIGFILAKQHVSFIGFMNVTLIPSSTITSIYSKFCVFSIMGLFKVNVTRIDQVSHYNIESMTMNFIWQITIVAFIVCPGKRNFANVMKAAMDCAI